jgi:hypothetical protein
MMNAAQGMQVEKVLDDLIYRLTNADASAEVRAALVEARRLKSVTTRWAAIPPPPDARREMLARVMELIASVNTPDISPSRPPPPRSGPPSRPPPRRSERDTPVADAALPREALPSSHHEEPSVPPKRGASGSPAAPQRTSPPERTSPPQRTSPPVGGAKTAPPPKPVFGSQTGLRTLPGARSTAPTRKPPPPPPRSTKPPPPRAHLPDAEELDAGDVVIESAPRSGPATLESGRPKTESKPLSLRAPPPVSDRQPTRHTPTHPQPFARVHSAPPPEKSAPPIVATGSARGEGLEGLSSSISSSQRRAVEAQKRASDARSLPRAHTMEFGRVREVSASVAAGVALVRPDATDWQPHPIAVGASVKLLYHNNKSGTYTALVRLAPGAQFPPRKHVQTEEMFMVSGSALVGEVEMRAGEYCRADEGSVHPPIRSVQGCSFLLSGSENDEMLVGDEE